MPKARTKFERGDYVNIWDSNPWVCPGVCLGYSPNGAYVKVFWDESFSFEDDMPLKEKEISRVLPSHLRPIWMTFNGWQWADDEV